MNDKLDNQNIHTRADDNRVKGRTQSCGGGFLAGHAEILVATDLQQNSRSMGAQELEDFLEQLINAE